MCCAETRGQLGMVTRNNISSYLLVVVAFVLATTVVVGSQCSPLFCEDVIKRLKIGRSGSELTG